MGVPERGAKGAKGTGFASYTWCTSEALVCDEGLGLGWGNWGVEDGIREKGHDDQPHGVLETAHRQQLRWRHSYR